MATCGSVDPATPVVILPPAVAGDVLVVCCVLEVVTVLAGAACDVWVTVAGVLTVGTLSVIRRDGTEETAALVVVAVVVVL